jgi:capsular polysaccharide biosynthesis protein
VELEAESTPANRSWTPVVPVPQETVAVAMFQWKRLPLTKKIVMRYAALFVAIMIGTAVLGYVVSSLGPAKYGARSEITYPIDASVASGSFMRQDRILQTQLVALKSQTVLQSVADKYHTSVKALSKQVTATVLQDSEVIRIEVDDASPARAKELVGAVVAAYFTNRGIDANTAIEKQLNDQMTILDGKIGVLQRQIANLEAARLTQNPVPPETAAELQAQSELTNLTTQQGNLATQISNVGVSQVATPHVKQLTQPYLLSGKVAPKPVQGAIAGFLAGIMIAALVVGLLIRRLLKREPDSVA